MSLTVFLTGLSNTIEGGYHPNRLCFYWKAESSMTMAMSGESCSSDMA
jgi:hypothetical protein